MRSLPALALSLTPLLPLTCAAEEACLARSGASALPVVEIYTSEGCSSCPPADRWASTLTGRSDVVALAFHVSYWDRLGWKDRFASAAYTERQAMMVAAGASRYAYTPQVLLNGRDLPSWPSAELRSSGPAPLQIELRRTGDGVDALIRPEASRLASTTRLSAYWAITEDGFSSNVKAGENAGATLHHDHVVQRYEPVAAWPSGSTQTLHLADTASADGHPRHVVLVVQDAQTLRPLQALALGC